MIFDVIDHGLPLVALKKQRRYLVMSLRGHRGLIRKDAISEIAAIRIAISAIEAVIADIDDDIVSSASGYGLTQLQS